MGQLTQLQRFEINELEHYILFLKYHHDKVYKTKISHLNNKLIS